MFKSMDGGASWSSFNTGLTNTKVHALAIDPLTLTTVYAATDAGVFDIEQVGVVGTATTTSSPTPTATPHPQPRHRVVGSGATASCTEAALDAALAGGSLVTFDCGPEPVTITLTQQKDISSDTTVDGGGLITLDGNHAVRVFTVEQGVALSVENLTIVNGSLIGTTGGAVSNGGAIYNLGGTQHLCR